MVELVQKTLKQNHSLVEVPAAGSAVWSMHAASLKIPAVLIPQSSANSLILDLGVGLGFIFIGSGATISIFLAFALPQRRLPDEEVEPQEEVGVVAAMRRLALSTVLMCSPL